MTLTDAQKKSIEILKERWSTVGEPWPLPCDDCVMVNVHSEETGATMVIGIEVDGHRHS